MPKKKKKKSWKERQRERHIRQQRAQEVYQIQREREAERKPRKWRKGKVLGAICLLVLIFGAYVAWQYTKPSVILEEPPPLTPTGGAIYVRADGSVDPSTASILNAGNIYYTFTADIHDLIVIERDNIVVDGANYTLQGTGGSDSKGIDLTGRSNVTITNIKIKDFDYGVYLLSASNSVLSQNDLTNNNCSIYFEYSSNNTLSGNGITNNQYGIYFEYSSNNTLSGNGITNNQVGIELSESSSNVISGNRFFNCGLLVKQSYGNVVVDSLVNDKPLVYLEGVSDYAVDNAGQVILVNCANILVENLNLSNASIGVQLLATSNTQITNNNITNNNWYGIYLYSSSNNTISGNNITNNQVGIELSESSNNRNYHNNFIDNAEQAYSYDSTNVWDDGYPSGGNYWSDYEERYPDADELDGSGIWNTPYVIDENNQDNYPLMNL